jgi:hypothetical protein
MCQGARRDFQQGYAFVDWDILSLVLRTLRGIVETRRAPVYWRPSRVVRVTLSPRSLIASLVGSMRLLLSWLDGRLDLVQVQGRSVDFRDQVLRGIVETRRAPVYWRPSRVVRVTLSPRSLIELTAGRLLYAFNSPVSSISDRGDKVTLTTRDGRQYTGISACTLTHWLTCPIFVAAARCVSRGGSNDMVLRTALATGRLLYAFNSPVSSISDRGDKVTLTTRDGRLHAVYPEEGQMIWC